MNLSRKEPQILLAVVAVALIVSRVNPYDPLTWFLEIVPILIIAPILIVTHRKFPLTPLLYRLLFVHALILILGGHYTYARVPVGYWFQDLLDLSRNHYDRLGHFAQGFIPALLVREILLRRSPLVRGKWLFFLAVSVCLAFSAFYEFTEWWAAVAGGESAENFLGTQGDIWDTQWDMFLAFVGAISSLLILSRTHDRQLEKLQESSVSEHL